MEYLLDLRWTDPAAKALSGVLSVRPDGIDQTTASVPQAMSRGFTVLRAEDACTLEKIADAMTAAGANVRIMAKETA